MNRSLLLAVSLVLVAWLSPGALGAEDRPASRKPNILWLIAEDFGPHLGCYGTKEVSTPNLDRLAANGMRFTRAFTTAPVCSPSRSAFMTGMYATTLGVHHHRTTDKKPLPDGVKLLTQWLKDAGYFTANVVQLPPALGFRGSGKTDWNFKIDGQPFDSRNWSDLPGKQPFFAQINLKETHRVFNAPPKADPARVELPPYYPDHPVARRDYAQYLDSATELDRKIGLILDQLKADGLADNTVVVFFGDNGEANIRAKQFCYEEGLHVPLIVHWPVALQRPKNFLAGTVNTQLVSSLDFAPTMLAIAGQPKPAKMQGRVLFGETTSPAPEYVFGARDRCDETAMRLRTVRDVRFRYIRNFTPEVPFLATNRYKETQYPMWNLMKELHTAGKLTPTQEFLCQPTQPTEELYDLETDPHQIRNLVASTPHQRDLARLRQALDRWIVETDDQGRFPEAPSPKAP